MSADTQTQNSKHNLFQNRRFLVTTADVRTRTGFYPIVDTVGRIRRDILYFALALSFLIGFALWRYYDLWYSHERIAMGVAITAALLIGSQFSLLQLDARGFPSKIWLARSSTVKNIFDAITQARALAAQGGGGFEIEDTGGDVY